MSPSATLDAFSSQPSSCLLLGRLLSQLVPISYGPPKPLVKGTVTLVGMIMTTIVASLVVSYLVLGLLRMALRLLGIHVPPNRLSRWTGKIARATITVILRIFGWEEHPTLNGRVDNALTMTQSDPRSDTRVLLTTIGDSTQSASEHVARQTALNNTPVTEATQSMSAHGTSLLFESDFIYHDCTEGQEGTRTHK